MPRQAGKAAGEGQDSVAGLAGAEKSGIAVSNAFRPTRIGLVPRPDFGPIENMVRDELLERFRHYAKQMLLFDKRLGELRQAFPQAETLLEIYGIGLYSALLIVAENRAWRWISIPGIEIADLPFAENGWSLSNCGIHRPPTVALFEGAWGWWYCWRDSEGCV